MYSKKTSLLINSLNIVSENTVNENDWERARQFHKWKMESSERVIQRMQLRHHNQGLLLQEIKDKARNDLDIERW